MSKKSNVTEICHFGNQYYSQWFEKFCWIAFLRPTLNERYFFWKKNFVFKKEESSSFLKQKIEIKVALLYSCTLQSVEIESAKIKSAKFFYCISGWFRQFWAILIFSHFRFLHFAKCDSKETLTILIINKLYNKKLNSFWRSWTKQQLHCQFNSSCVR